MSTVNFGGHDYDVFFQFGKYSNDRLAIIALDSETFEQVGVPTVNIVDWELTDSTTEPEVFIKNYSENEGVLDSLGELGYIDVIEQVTLGFTHAYRVRLTGALKTAAVSYLADGTQWNPEAQGGSAQPEETPVDGDFKEVEPERGGHDITGWSLARAVLLAATLGVTAECSFRTLRNDEGVAMVWNDRAWTKYEIDQYQAEIDAEIRQKAMYAEAQRAENEAFQDEGTANYDAIPEPKYVDGATAAVTIEKALAEDSTEDPA